VPALVPLWFSGTRPPRRTTARLNLPSCRCHYEGLPLALPQYNKADVRRSAGSRRGCGGWQFDIRHRVRHQAGVCTASGVSPESIPCRRGEHPRTEPSPVTPRTPVSARVVALPRLIPSTEERPHRAPRLDGPYRSPDHATRIWDGLGSLVSTPLTEIASGITFRVGQAQLRASPLRWRPGGSPKCTPLVTFGPR